MTQYTRKQRCLPLQCKGHFSFNYKINRTSLILPFRLQIHSSNPVYKLHGDSVANFNHLFPHLNTKLDFKINETNKINEESITNITAFTTLQ